MKPIKGMNTDVSPANALPGTYRKAQNFIYGKELDSLLQEPGFRELAVSLDALGVLGAVPLKGDDFLLFVYARGDTVGVGSAILKFSAATESLSTVVEDDNYKFLPTSVLDAVTFFNESNEEHVIFTDGVNPIRIINIETPQTNLTLNKLFSEHDSVVIEGHISGTPGGFRSSTSFFCVAFEHVDGSVTGFQSVHGPFISPPRGAVAYDLTISNVDMDYTHLQIGCISVVNGAYETKVLTRLPIYNNVIKVTVDNYSTYREISLEGLVGQSLRYTAARTLTLHSNRLYLGNLTQSPEDNLQEVANKIQPMWVYGNVADVDTFHTVYMEERAYPKETLFMPDEVYAFYVEYTRTDGSVTQAYHIPGEAPRDIRVAIDTVLTDGTDQSYFINISSDSLINVMGIPTSGSFNDYYHSDLRIQGGVDNAKYFRTRSSTEYDGMFSDTQDTNIRGRMCYWENENEVYADTFPDQKRFTTTAVGPGAEATLTTVSIGLAGKKVRHHKFPSMQFFSSQPLNNSNPFPDTFAGGDDPRVPNIKHRKGITIEFDHVIIPEGYQSVRFFHAKRVEANTTVLGQGPLQYGHTNSYAQESTADIDVAYKDFTSSVGMNVPLLDAIADTSGTPLALEDLGLLISQARMHPLDMMVLKPFLSKTTGAHYIKNEYIVTTEPIYPTTNSVEWFFQPTEGGLNINTLFDTDAFVGRERRNRLLQFNNITDGIVTPVRAFHAVRSIKESQYLAPGVIDSETRRDNRAGEECVAFTIEHTYEGSPVVDSGWGIGEESAYQDILFNKGASGGYGFYTFSLGQLLSNFSHYYAGISVGSSVTNSHYISNFCAYRENVCVPYPMQDLVVCSSVIRPEDLLTSIVTPESQQPVDILNTLLNSVYTTIGRVGYSKTWGDVVYSNSTIRNTSQVGWRGVDSGISPSGIQVSVDGTYNSFAIASSAGAGVNSGVTLSEDIGSLRVTHIDAVLGRVNGALRDTEQLKISDYLRLGGVLNTTSPEHTNDFTYDLSFLQLNIFPGKTVHTLLNEGTERLPFRVARSAAMAVDTDKLNLRYFPALDAFEQTRDRGEIVNIQSFNDKLIIHHELGLFVTRGKENLSTSAGQITFGDGDVFATTPVEVIPSPLGYAGTQHLLSCALTPAGYFFADESQGKLFRYTDTIVDIGSSGISQDLKRTLRVRKDLASSEAFNGYYPGITTTWDPVLERVLFQLRNFTDSSPISIGGHGGDSNALQGYYDSPTREVKDFTLSFYAARNLWLSYHTYESTLLCGTRDALYSIEVSNDVSGLSGVGGSNLEGLTIYKHNDTEAGVGLFVPGSDKRSYIDLAFPFGTGAVVSGFSWYTKAVEGDVSFYGYKDHNATFTHAIVSNDYQCSGLVELVKTDSTNNLMSNMRKAEFLWFFNGFRDLVADRDLRFLDADGEVVASNIDNTKSWYEQRRFIGNFVNLRLIIENADPTTRSLYLYDIDAKARKSYR